MEGKKLNPALIMTALLPLPTSIERRDRLAARDRRPVAPAVYLGIQEGFGIVPDIELWNLTADAAGLGKAGFTLSRASIIAAGYRLPAS